MKNINILLFNNILIIYLHLIILFYFKGFYFIFNYIKVILITKSFIYLLFII